MANDLPKRLIGFLPKKYRDDTEEILDNMDEALSSYIQGQVIVACFVGALAYIGYLILGLPYALILGLTALFTNFIPFIGPWIGTAPGVIVGFFESPVHSVTRCRHDCHYPTNRKQLDLTSGHG